MTERASVDLAIVGGGVVGLCLAYEAARTGQTVALLERRADFAQATSANWFRILHGGLRYLQSLDLVRHRESVEARREWLRDFPDLVEPLPCLMLLTGRGLKRPALFRAAFAMDAALASWRNRGIRPDRHLPRGRILSVGETRDLLPCLQAPGLQGAARWTDAVAKDAARLTAALAARARAAGAELRPSHPVQEILVEHGKVHGVRLANGETVRAETVVTTTGPWTDLTLAHLPSVRRRDLFRPSLAFNLVLDRPAPFEGALAVQARRPNAPVLFVYPLQGRTFAGTWHAPWIGAPDAPQPPERDLLAFIDDLADALPWLDLDLDAVQAVHAGLLPVGAAGSTELTNRPLLVDHGAEGGPSGLYSAAAIKFTTAPQLARKLLASLPRSQAR
ncbi:FAD-dependent oxidoreductase [Geminicoccus roseus]|uniref:FAD-dependent oxidoreductase n=1 Tax=Geminicoccus roseus TaxID=404900 RepID=UPI0004045DC1|nr:FAD-dependent oxidoreductase [Geminicoccus roseus]